MAENLGLMGELGDWVLVEACRQMKRFSDEGLKLAKVAINVSAEQFCEAFVQRVGVVIDESGIEPGQLELGLTEATIRSRVRRLEESNTMRVVAVTDIEAAGYGMLLAVGVQVEGRSPDDVARDLASEREVFSVNVVVGAQDLEILVVAEDQAALNELMEQRLAKIPGVRRLTPALAVDVLKNQPDWVPFHEPA